MLSAFWQALVGAARSNWRRDSKEFPAERDSEKQNMSALNNIQNVIDHLKLPLT